jgi:hypothetical protein
LARRLLIILSASLLLFGAACGTTDDDAKTKTSTEDKASDDTATDDTVDDEGDKKGDGSNDEFCGAVVELEALFEGLDDTDYQGFVDAIKDAEGTFETYVEGLPDDLKDEGEMLVEAVRTLAEDFDALEGDPDAEAKAEAASEKLNTPELDAAGDATTEYEEETCGTT